MQALKKPNPSAVTAASQVTRKRSAEIPAQSPIYEFHGSFGNVLG
jgi:hypothetical protein